MAVLYENGLGVQRDPTRACALYLRRSGEPGPFGHQAMTLLPAIQASMSAEERDLCMSLAVLGFDHRFEPVTFTLDVGHTIDFRLGNQIVVATVAYDGGEKRIDVPFAGAGTVFLPIQHTELASHPARRHFIEIPMWIPKAPGTWAVMWQLFEVVRDGLVHITAAELESAAGARPPIRTSQELRRMAQVRLTDSGQVEWVVTTGPEPRRDLIESIAEQQEMKEDARRRREAEAAVDWTRKRDINRPPALAYGDADGCGSVFVYGWTADRMEALSVRADKTALALSTTPQTFDLTQHPGRLEIAAHVFASPQRGWQFCSDVRVLPEPAQEKWMATSGAVTIELSPPGIRVRHAFMYRATIRITGAEFMSPNGVRVKQTQPITLTAIVGWVSG